RGRRARGPRRLHPGPRRKRAVRSRPPWTGDCRAFRACGPARRRRGGNARHRLPARKPRRAAAMSRSDRATPGWLGLMPALVLAVLFLVPFAIMLSVSVAERVPGGFFEPGFDLASYQRFFSIFFAEIMLVSVGICAAAAAICVALAFPFTLFLTGLRRRWQTVILVILLAVLSLSEVIIGFSLSTLLSRTAGVGNLLAWAGLTEEARAYTPSLFALLVGLCYLGFPYAVLVLY